MKIRFCSKGLDCKDKACLHAHSLKEISVKRCKYRNRCAIKHCHYIHTHNESKMDWYNRVGYKFCLNRGLNAYIHAEIEVNRITSPTNIATHYASGPWACDSPDPDCLPNPPSNWIQVHV